MYSPIVQRTPANNPAELTAVLETKIIDHKDGSVKEVKYSGPYYPHHIRLWVEQAVEKSGSVYCHYFIRDFNDLTDEQKRKINDGKTVKPLNRIHCKHEDGTESFQYTL